MMHIGKVRRDLKTSVDVSSQYLKLSREDERAAKALAESGCYRHACYFILQSMEKLIRAKIFTFVDPMNPYFIQENKSHSIESAVEFLIGLGKDGRVQKQIQEQITRYVLGTIKYSWLHNNLRYPFYSEKHNSYSTLDISSKDYDELLERLSKLRDFLKDIDRVLR